MTRTAINLLLDTLLLGIALTVLFTSTVLRFVFPAATSAAGWTLWGYDYNAWANLQYGLVALIGLAILVHVMLHWSWVCAAVTSQVLGRRGPGAKLDDGSPTLYGVGLLIVVLTLLGLLLAGCYFSISPPVEA